MNELLSRLDESRNPLSSPKDLFKYLKEQEPTIEAIINKHRNDLNYHQFILKIIHYAHECGFEELVRLIFERIENGDLLQILKESLEKYILDDSDSGNLCQVNSLFSGLGCGSMYSPFGMLSEIVRNNVQNNYLSKQYGDKNHVYTFLKYCFNEFVNVVFSNDPYSFFKGVLYSLIVIRKEDVGKRRKTTPSSDISKGLYKFNFKNIIQLCDTNALRKQFFGLLILVVLVEIPQEKLESILPSFIENEILEIDEISELLLETLKEKNVENSIIVMVYNALAVLENDLGSEEESRGFNSLCKVLKFKEKILNDYPNMFYSEDEVFLRDINSTNNFDVIITQVETKSVEDLLKFITLSDNTNKLQNSTLACMYVIIERLMSGAIESSLTGQVLMVIKAYLLEFINFATNEFCTYYKDIVLEGKDVTDMDPNTRRWKDTMIKTFHLIGNLQHVFFDTDINQEQAGLTLLPVDNQIIEDMSYLYLFAKVLEATGCAELSKNISRTLLRLLNISNSDHRETINNNDIKELFNESLYITLCVMKDETMKIPMGEEEIEAIQYMHTLFRKSENVSIPKVVIEILGFMLYSIVNSEEESSSIISNHMMFVIPRLLTFRDAIEIKLSSSGTAKANVPQPLYMLTKFIDLSQNEKIITPRNIYTALCFMVAIIESYSKHFYEKLDSVPLEKRPAMFLYIEECSKLLVFKFSALIHILNNRMVGSNGLDFVYLQACTSYMSFISAFLLKLSKSRKIELVSVLIKQWYDKLYQEPNNPNHHSNLQTMEQVPVFLLFHHLLKTDYFLRMMSHENSVIGVKLLTSAEKTGKIFEYFSIYVDTWLDIATNPTSTNIDKTTSKSLSKAMLEIFNQYISAKEPPFEPYSHIDTFTNTTLKLFKSEIINEARNTLLKIYDKIAEMEMASLAFLNSLDELDARHPLHNFLEILEKKPKEDGVTFSIKYNNLMILEKMAKHMKRLIPKYPEKIDSFIDFLKKHSIVQRMIAIINTKDVEPNISEESLNSYFNYYGTLLEAILPLLTILPKNEEYSINLISEPALTTLLCKLFQNNRKHILKKFPKLLSTIFTLYEKCLQIFVVYSKTSREHAKLEELREKLFSKSFIFVIKTCFVNIPSHNQDDYLWKRSDDIGRDLPNSLINIIFEISQAIISAPNLFKNYSQVLEENGVLPILQKVDLPHPKLKTIIERLSGNNPPQPKESSVVKQYPSFAKPSSFIPPPANTTPPATNSSNNARFQNTTNQTSPNPPVFRPPDSAVNQSTTTTKQVFRPPPRK